MNIVSIEPTPSPNTMKINLDKELPMGTRNNYKKENQEGAPAVISEILKIDGVKGVYHVADFLAIERHPKYDWEEILQQIRVAFGEKREDVQSQQHLELDSFGEIKVQVQMFKGIPLQVKLTTSSEERRFGMPESFTKLVDELITDEDNYILLRSWKDQGVRYGDFDEIGKEVVEELMAAYPPERVKELVEQAKNHSSNKQITRERHKLTLADLAHPDWQKRYQMLEQMDDPTLEDLPVLDKALADEKASIRRLATVYLGMIEDEKVLPYLYKALQDKTVTVRRTAGDCLSDLGFKEAQGEMIKALQDKSKLVRWRAAMFLYEVGDEQALPALKAAENDPEFEVRMQIKLAIGRIEQGEEAKGSIWKQMTELRNEMKSQ